MKYTLNQSQIEIIQGIKDPYKKRDYIQDEIGIPLFKGSGFNLVCTWATSIGKTIFACKIMKKIRDNGISHEIHIVVPYQTLKDQWEEEIRKFELENVKVFIINSYFKIKQYPYLLIADEVHKQISNPETIASKINDLPIKYRLYLSATLKADQIKYLKSKGLHTEFNIDLKVAGLLDLIPKFSVYNIYVDLTDKEKEKYKKSFTDFEFNMDFFKAYGISKLPASPPSIPGEDDKKVRIMYYQAQGARAKYMSVIANAENKLKVIKELLPYLEERRTIFFSKSQKRATTIAKMNNMAVYHSGQSLGVQKQNLEDYVNNKHYQIASVMKLIAGFDDPTSDTIVREYFDSTKQSSVQSCGRIIRYNKNDVNKSPAVLNLVCRPFDDITPSDNWWINISTQGMTPKWVELDEIKLILKNLTDNK